MRIAVIGAGSMGKKYITWIGDGQIPHLQLAAVRTGNDETRDWLGARYPAVTVASDTEQLYRRDGFDAVLIASPHRFHPQLATEALSRGKHVLCEKPAGVSVLQAGRLGEYASRAGRALAFLYQNRTLPVYGRLKEMLERGELGQLQRIHLHCTRYFRTAAYHASSAWRSSWCGEGGGLLINQAQHQLDLWQWLFGMPAAVEAQIHFGKYNDFCVDDEALVRLRYPGAVTATAFFSTGELPKEERWEIVGSRKKVAVSGDRMSIWAFGEALPRYRKTASWHSDEGIAVDYREEAFPATQDPYLLTLENFERHIRLGEPLTVAGEEGANALELCNAAYLSATSRREVALPVDGQAYERWLQERMDEEAPRG